MWARLQIDACEERGIITLPRSIYRLLHLTLHSFSNLVYIHSHELLNALLYLLFLTPVCIRHHPQDLLFLSFPSFRREHSCRYFYKPHTLYVHNGTLMQIVTLTAVYSLIYHWTITSLVLVVCENRQASDRIHAVCERTVLVATSTGKHNLCRFSWSLEALSHQTSQPYLLLDASD